MDVGVVLPNFSDLRHRDAMRTLARSAEELGFASIWTLEHVLVPKSMFDRYGDSLDSLTTLTYLAACTRRVRLGTSVLILPLHEPVALARRTATLHHLSEGRLLLGVGVGWCAEEFALLGVDFDGRAALADEYLDVLRTLFTSDQPTHAGPTVAFDDVPFAPRPETVLPLLVGRTPPALRRAVLRGDGWHGVWLEPDEVAAKRGLIDQRRREAGPDRPARCTTGLPDQPAIDTCILDEAGSQEVRPGLYGTVQEVAEKVTAYQVAGVDHLVLDFMDREDATIPPVTDILRQLERLASDLPPPLA